MSLFADYIKERLNDDIVETEEGFATYRFIDADGTKAVYIVDIYVRPGLRKSGIAAQLADKVVVDAKEKGCSKLIGTVVPSTINSTTSLQVLLGYGMKLKSSSNDLIIFEKGI